MCIARTDRRSSPQRHPAGTTPWTTPGVVWQDKVTLNYADSVVTDHTAASTVGPNGWVRYSGPALNGTGTLFRFLEQFEPVMLPSAIARLKMKAREPRITNTAKLTGLAARLIKIMEDDNGCYFAMTPAQTKRLNNLCQSDEAKHWLTPSKCILLAAGEQTEAKEWVAKCGTSKFGNAFLKRIHRLLSTVFNQPGGSMHHPHSIKGSYR